MANYMDLQEPREVLYSTSPDSHSFSAHAFLNPLLLEVDAYILTLS